MAWREIIILNENKIDKKVLIACILLTIIVIAIVVIYIIGNKNSWVTAEQLITEFSRLNSKTSDKYSLDWKWEYEDGKDAQDTYIGENMDDIYKLNISIYFEQV